jgi:hypothetical protein
MTIAVPATGETFEARLVADDFGVLRLIAGKHARIDYVLSAVLALGWRVVDATPAERALLETQGFASGWVQ